MLSYWFFGERTASKWWFTSSTTIVGGFGKLEWTVGAEFGGTGTSFLAFFIILSDYSLNFLNISISRRLYSRS